MKEREEEELWSEQTYAFFISLRHVMSFNSGALREAPRMPTRSAKRASTTIYVSERSSG